MSRDLRSQALITALIVAGAHVLGAGQALAGTSPWYVEARLVRTDINATLGVNWPKFFDDEDDGIGVELGYRLNPYFALQLGYQDFGDFQGFGSPCPEDAELCILTLGDPQDLALRPLVVTPLTAEVSGLSLTAVPTWPINDRFSLFGKLGVLDWDADVSESHNGRRVDSFSDTELLAGVGLRYAWPSGFGVAAEYQQVDLDLGSTSLGASWRF